MNSRMQRDTAMQPILRMTGIIKEFSGVREIGDVIYAHNDPMAYGAYQAAKELGIEKDIKFIGIDALPNEGCVWVREGILTATFQYPTPGAAGLDIALEILEKKRPIHPGERITLPTATVTIDNVNQFLK